MLLTENALTEEDKSYTIVPYTVISRRAMRFSGKVGVPLGLSRVLSRKGAIHCHTMKHYHSWKWLIGYYNDIQRLPIFT